MAENINGKQNRLIDFGLVGARRLCARCANVVCLSLLFTQSVERCTLIFCRITKCKQLRSQDWLAPSLREWIDRYIWFLVFTNKIIYRSSECDRETWDEQKERIIIKSSIVSGIFSYFTQWTARAVTSRYVNSLNSVLAEQSEAEKRVFFTRSLSFAGVSTFHKRN